MNVHSLSNRPNSRRNLRFRLPRRAQVRRLHGLLGKLPNRNDHAERDQAVNYSFENISALFFRLDQQLVSVFVFHVPPFFFTTLPTVHFV